MTSQYEVERKEAKSSTEVLVIVLMLTGLVQAIWGLLQLNGFARSFHSGFKITGTFFNPAPYALYLLALLYNEIGQTGKAVVIARSILNKDVKVESEATEEIRAAMIEIIRKSDNRKIISE